MTTSQYRIVVDRDLCQGHGVCESEAPAVFAVSKDGVLTVLQESPPDTDRNAVEQAATFCPTHALSIIEEP
ncbi:MAG TPA: ferredoxin [Acidimicrobiales bacterium]|nr:ferredoxin [Acidimicrobiales bacterium]